jgi:hypothetical protein
MLLGLGIYGALTVGILLFNVNCNKKHKLEK